jgi:hypothetical protein
MSIYKSCLGRIFVAAGALAITCTEIRAQPLQYDPQKAMRRTVIERAAAQLEDCTEEAATMSLRMGERDKQKIEASMQPCVGAFAMQASFAGMPAANIKTYTQKMMDAALADALSVGQ